jgi:AraC family ethanolamine operon transcriptional activator
LTLSELCKESKVSERTLQYAFKDRYGLTPKEYIKNYNLRMVRNKLKMSRKGARIQDVASEFGFWHMGQFASDYKRHFGELPSESLIRSK